MQLKQHYVPACGYSPLVVPPSHGFERLEFGVLLLGAGETYAGSSGGRECGLVILTGTCSVHSGAEFYGGIGGRRSVFDGRATAVYVPRESDFSIEAGADGVEIAVCTSPAERTLPPHLVGPEEVVVCERGHTGFRRFVHDVIGPHVEADSILVGETFTPAGNWSGYPPHKHDRDAPPREVAQEEVYFFKLRPENGFGIQYMYSAADAADRAPIDVAYAVHNNDLTVIPYGYHPVAAPPGYDVYYLWFLTGSTRLLLPHDDPAHSWIGAGEPVARTYPR